MSFRAYFSTVAEALKKKPPTIHATVFMTGIAWRVGKLIATITGKKPAITKDTVASSQTTTQFSNEKIKAALPNITFSSVKDAVRNAAEFHSKI